MAESLSNGNDEGRSNGITNKAFVPEISSDYYLKEVGVPFDENALRKCELIVTE